MSFYSLSPDHRKALSEEIRALLQKDFESSGRSNLIRYFSDGDTYIRKVAYLATGKIYKTNTSLKAKIVSALGELLSSEESSVRQTVINSAGEIGMYEFEAVKDFFETGLFDEHHSVRNAVIGSVKKMGQKNPVPVLRWAEKYLHHPDKEIRREICHGIELRGRSHPEDILPLLKELQFDKTARVRNTLIHVLGQISYKKGCLATVLTHLKQWENQELVESALKEILEVHERYRDFAFLSPEASREQISQSFGK
jgi:hypothetical protein